MLNAFRMRTRILKKCIKYYLCDLIYVVISCCVWSCDTGYDKITIESQKKHCNNIYFTKLTTENNVLIVSVIVYSSNCHILQFLYQMFNVSTLLLNEALLNMLVRKSSCFQLLLLRHWQGSVAIHLRCGGIFSNSIITNFLPILAVRNVWKLVNIRWS